MSQKPERFGKYILLEKLAAGGMAEIFLAKSPGASGISKFVAIKRILQQFSTNEDFVRMFKDEAKIVINLSHRNIVSMYEFDVVNEQFHIVMDYVEGKNVRQILQKMKKKDTYFTTEQIVYLIKEVAAGLDHAHRCLDSATGKPLNITHRDISPQNVMVSYEGDVKIVDFGIAKAESQLENTRAGTLKGKFGYMSPEQAEGQPVDLRTDIFSLGTVLWELLANDRLFISNNEINTLKKIRECKIPSLKKYNPNIHPELERITLKALHKDRNHRYQTAAAMHRDLNRFLNRQYPDFSPQDFSASIKTIFADNILRIRKKLMEYSKVELDNLTNATSIIADDDKTRAVVNSSAVVETKTLPMDKTRTRTETKSRSNDRTTLTRPNKNKAENSEATIEQIDLSEDTREVDLNITQINEMLSKGQYGKKSKGSLREDYYGDNYEDTNLADLNVFRENTVIKENTSRGYNINKSYRTRTNIKAFKKDKPSAINKILRSFLILFLLFVGGTMYYEPMICDTPMKGYMNYMIWLETQCNNLAVVNPKQTSPKNAEVATKPPIDDPFSPGSLDVLTNITIQSEPSGADIYIDGESISQLTPAVIAVPKFRPFTLQLKRDGFVTYRRENILVSKQKVKKVVATLLEAQIAYINIDVRPAANAQVYINGKRLKEKLPIKGFALPANKKIVFEAYNPKTGAKVKRKLKFQNRQSANVILRF